MIGYGSGVAFHGDIYVGRVVEGQNKDFTCEEMGSSAPWLRAAASENLQRQGLSNSVPPSQKKTIRDT